MVTSTLRRSSTNQWLVAGSTFFAFAVLVHNLDHLRRGGASVSAGVFWLGTLAIVDEVAVVVLARMRHRLAPLAAAVSGAMLAAGYVFVHFTPRRTWLSDSFVSGHASPVSIVAAALETVAALVLAVAGYVLLTDPSPPSAPPVPATSALRHPVVVAMILGNAAILVGALATR